MRWCWNRQTGKFEGRVRERVGSSPIHRTSFAGKKPVIIAGFFPCIYNSDILCGRPHIRTQPVRDERVKPFCSHAERSILNSFMADAVRPDHPLLIRTEDGSIWFLKHIFRSCINGRRIRFVGKTPVRIASEKLEIRRNSCAFLPYRTKNFLANPCAFLQLVQLLRYSDCL